MAKCKRQLGGKRRALQQAGLEVTGESELPSGTQTSGTKMTSKWVINLNVKPKAIKVVEGNVLENLYDFWLRQ